MRTVDLFAGCGGLSAGFQQADYELTLAIEHWDVAREVYASNFDHHVVDFDLSNTFDAARIIRRERPRIIIGGPPCQDYSAAGGRAEGEHAKLTVSFATIVDAVRPRWFVLENVVGIHGSNAWRKGRKILSNAGYGITEVILNAAYYGVPQARRRFFAIGCIGEDDDFLFDAIASGATENPLSVRDFVGNEFGIEFYYRHPRNWGRRGVFSLDEPSPTVRSTNRPVPPGYKPHPDDAGPAKRARPLTTAERALVQTFDRSFRFSGTTTDQDMMIANAVPVVLAKYVASAIAHHEEERFMSTDEKFRAWLTSTQDYTARTAGNVISRLKRASRMLGKKTISGPPLNAIHALERREEFTTLSPAVRSQIKKAIRLQAQFRGR